MGTGSIFEAANAAVAGATSTCDGISQAPKEYGGDAALLVLIEVEEGCRRNCPNKYCGINVFSDQELTGEELTLQLIQNVLETTGASIGC